ncbi:diguanylate cyclase [Butyrivibrio sp. CB08]|uniref:sensor domain-containing diguanylate cyclase n=1 Tax=Butyrivibrio sp. CB08 TaxID=2364879 RepID=UPI000EAA1600|nr:diguanylate cyclase [Butyrivibrio sp. CB08]RKM56134.1 diguanylate cyclase [Butyrivibrio sp. CB08]
MKKRLTELKSLLKKLGFIGVIPFVFWPLFFLAVSFFVYKTEYELSMENIESRTVIETNDVAEDFNDYINNVTLIVDTASETVNDMITQGDSADDVQAYLERKSLHLNSIMSGDTKGIYGYVMGQYVDGDKWVPDAGYVPTERVWYKEAMNANGTKVVIDPYIDARTGKLVVTAAKLLSDKKSVISIDIWLSRMQQMTEDVAGDNPEQEVMIIDEGGTVIAHSIPDEVGKNYRETEEADNKKIYIGLRKSGGRVYMVKYNGEDYLFCPKKISDTWTVITMTSAEPVMRDVRQLTRVVMLSSFLGILITLGIVYSMTNQKLKLMNSDDNVDCIANIYMAMHKVDLDTRHLEVVACKDPRTAKIVADDKGTADEIMRNIASHMCDERSKSEVIDFMNLDTLDERIGPLSTISIEFLNVDHMWTRGRYIVAERRNDGTLKSVIWAVENIDTEKRSRDKLRYLAEIDQLTQINNRGSGEDKIRNALKTGDGGMFVLFDVDRFKSINDNFGHNTGDKVLMAIGEAMRKTFREKDIILRLGGDEFAAYTPTICSIEAGRPVINRLIHSIENIDIPELSGAIVNISVGAAFYLPDDNFSFEELYKHADSCTYESKKTKGSFVTFYQNASDF